MSEYAGTTVPSASAIADWCMRNDQRTVLSNRVIPVRKATRYRGSTVVRRVDPSICKPRREVAEMIVDERDRWMSTPNTVAGSERKTVLRGGGRLTDYHRV